jgi:hypothetical protein
MILWYGYGKCAAKLTMVLICGGGGSRTIADGYDRVSMGKWMVWGQKLEPCVHQDTIGKLSSRPID